MKTAKEYIESLKSLNIKVYLFGKIITNPTEHSIIKPSMNAVAMTYEAANDPEYEALMTVTSNLTGRKINRFTHLHQSKDDLVKKVKMQRMLGQKTATCFQRCVGLDAANALYSSTFDVDQTCNTKYNSNFGKFWKYIQNNDLTVDGA